MTVKQKMYKVSYTFVSVLDNNYEIPQQNTNLITQSTINIKLALYGPNNRHNVFKQKQLIDSQTYCQTPYTGIR